MKNVKFEVINLSCGDVIVTSCKSAYGVIAIYDSQFYAGQLNGTSGFIDNKMFIQKINRNASGMEDGLYHIDSEGNIYEKCPYAENEYFVITHNLSE